MEFVPLSTLQEVSGYRDRRSVARWVHSTLGITMHKIGKSWCVNKQEYEIALRLRYGVTAKAVPAKNEYAPQCDSERAFLSDLNDLLAQGTEV